MKRKRLSDTAFLALFGVWILTAVPGFVLALTSILVLLAPALEVHDSGTSAPPIDVRTKALALGVGVALVAWPLALYRKADAPVRVEGFGRI